MATVIAHVLTASWRCPTLDDAIIVAAWLGRNGASDAAVVLPDVAGGWYTVEHHDVDVDRLMTLVAAMKRERVVDRETADRVLHSLDDQANIVHRERTWSPLRI